MPNTSPNTPRVVILGRPNVGKSTLFNRIFGHRRVITDPTPGVTRDTIEEQCQLATHSITLVDTGGIKADSEGIFDSMVSSKSLATLENASVIIFVLDILQMTGEDHIICEELRRYRKKVILAINKADTPEKDYLALEYYSLGYGEPLPVSAEHGRNIDLLKEAVVNQLSQVPDQDQVQEEEDSQNLTIALIGKPNVGKSTLTNCFSKQEVSLVSEVAGTTRDTVVGAAQYKGRTLKVIDTAGIRRKNKVAESIEYYAVNRAIKAIGTADVALLIIDMEEGLSRQDKKISTQALKRGCPIILVLNKWDVKTPDPRKLKKAVQNIHDQFPVLEWAPIVPISSLHGYGITRLLDMVIKVDKQQKLRIATGPLNRALTDWMTFTPPPTKGGQPFKVRYVTQVSVKPVRFVIFVNRTDGFPDSYCRFLINQLRKEFGFDSVPLAVNIKGVK